MKTLSQRIEEKLVINKNYTPYIYTPKSFDELKEIIKQRYKEQGPGTKQNPINFNDIDVSKITSFSCIFQEMEFKYIDISNWDVSNIENMSWMFYECEKLKSVGDLSNWNVSSVKDIHGIFYDCEQLESVGDLSNWDVSNIKSIWRMFEKCINLKSVGDLSNWDVSNVKNMDRMFENSGIKNIPDWYEK